MMIRALIRGYVMVGHVDPTKQVVIIVSVLKVSKGNIAK